MKTYWGNAGIAPYILNLGIRCRWVVSFTPRPLYPWGKNPQYPVGGWVGPRAGMDSMAKRKNLTVVPAGNWSPVSILTELLRFLRTDNWHRDITLLFPMESFHDPKKYVLLKRNMYFTYFERKVRIINSVTVLLNNFRNGQIFMKFCMTIPLLTHRVFVPCTVVFVDPSGSG